VRLNVGSRVFDTCPQTLTMSPYFDSFLEGRIGHAVDENGRLFIDRDGDLFAYLLNFMRTTKLYMPQSIILEKRQQLLGECEYFAMDWLSQRVRGEVSDFEQAPSDKLIREQELAGETFLLDVFATDMSLRDPIELQCQTLPCTADRPAITTCFGDFVRRFDELIGGWLPAVSIEGICFAGGAVIGTLVGRNVGDVDIFLTTKPENGKDILQKVLAAVQTAHKKRYGEQAKVLVTRSKNAITIFQAISDRPGGKPIQIVLSCYESVSDLLAKFDLDSCCFAFSPSENKVWCTARGKRSVVFSANLVDSRFDSPGYTRRLEKYDARGFRIAIPGFEESLVNRTVRETSYLYLQTYDLFLLVSGQERCNQEPVEITKSAGRSFKKAQVKINPACMQSAVALKGVRRLAAMKYGQVETISCDLCSGTRRGRTQCCLPLKTASLKYNIIWLPRDCEDDEPVEGYAGGTQAELVEQLLEAHVDLSMTTDSPDFEWWNGGLPPAPNPCINTHIHQALKCLFVDVHTCRSNDEANEAAHARKPGDRTRECGSKLEHKVSPALRVRRDKLCRQALAAQVCLGCG
jgi:hypothetical protein